MEVRASRAATLGPAAAAARPGSARRSRGEGQGVRIDRLRRARRMEQPCSFMYASTSCTCSLGGREFE